jgi:hypothetical protein
MGYRHYIAIIDKEKLEELKNKVYTSENYDDYDEDLNQDFMRQCDIQNNCIYAHCVGKLYYMRNNDVYDALYKERENLISDCDVECFVCSQDIFFELANIYLKLAQLYFKDLFEPFKKELIERKDIFENLSDEKKANIKKILNDINDKRYWLGRTFDKDKKDIEICDLFEYQAFNLMHLHKTTDFSKYVVICYAY